MTTPRKIEDTREPDFLDNDDIEDTELEEDDDEFEEDEDE